MALLESGKQYKISVNVYPEGDSSTRVRNAFINNYVIETGITDPNYSQAFLTTMHVDEYEFSYYTLNLPYINEPIVTSKGTLYIGLDIDFKPNIYNQADFIYGLSGTEIKTDWLRPLSKGQIKYSDSSTATYYNGVNLTFDTTGRNINLIIDTTYLSSHKFYTISLCSTSNTEEVYTDIYTAPNIFVCDMVDQLTEEHYDGVFILDSGNRVYDKNSVEGLALITDQDGVKQYQRQFFYPQRFNPYEHYIELKKVQFGRSKSNYIYLSEVVRTYSSFSNIVDYHKLVEYESNWLKDVLYKGKEKFIMGVSWAGDDSSNFIPVINENLNTGNIINPEPESEIKGYLEFSSDENFTLVVESPTWNGTMEYSIDNGSTWEVWNSTPIYGTSTQSILLRGTGNGYVAGNSWYDWIFTGKYIEGNIETLLDYKTVLNGEHPPMLPGCYSYMFRKCTSLIKAPELPATTLVERCYDSMFDACTSLIEAPKLPAITLAKYCYKDMFYGCTSLIEAPELPATELAESCYSDMFADCTSLTKTPGLPATTLAIYCYSSMFRNCTSLTKVPKLPATTLAWGCYYAMFMNCTSLIEIPGLPATTLAERCYTYMFDNCKKIKISAIQKEGYPYKYRIPKEGAGVTADDALYEMFNDTGGIYTFTPYINTTYYTSNEVI